LNDAFVGWQKAKNVGSRVFEKLFMAFRCSNF
jgi:hypothetical protein